MKAYYNFCCGISSVLLSAVLKRDSSLKKWNAAFQGQQNKNTLNILKFTMNKRLKLATAFILK